ncbi:DsrE family protein [Leifsonia sp. L25]|uniref:DsrE family protein n=1 Tax=Actinomycetes TaxID=1760 RepID=UPI003D696C1E
MHDEHAEAELCAVMPATRAAAHETPEAEALPAPSSGSRRALLIHGTGPNVESWFPQLLRTAQNARNSLGNDVEVTVVVQGPGVAALAADGGAAADVAATVDAGIGVIACGNSLAAVGLSSAALLPEVGVVPAAISYLARAQWEGAAYVRI